MVVLFNPQIAGINIFNTNTFVFMYNDGQTLDYIALNNNMNNTKRIILWKYKVVCMLTWKFVLQKDTSSVL